MKALFISDHSFQPKYDTNLRGWAHYNGIKVDQFYFNYPFEQRWSVLEIERRLFMLVTKLEDPELSFVICHGEVSLSLMLLIEGGTRPSELNSGHLIVHHAMSMLEEGFRRLNAWSPLEIKGNQVVFTSIPYRTGLTLDVSLSYLVLPSMPPKSTAIAVSASPASKAEIMEVNNRSLAGWKDQTLLPLFVLFDEATGSVVVCGRRADDNKKVFQVVPNGDPGVFVAVYPSSKGGQVSRPYLVESNLSLFDCFLMDQRKCHLVDLCDSPRCVHQEQPRMLYRFSFKPGKGYPYQLRPNSFHSKGSICRQDIETAPEDRIKLFNNSFSPSVRFQMKHRLFFADGGWETRIIKERVKIGYHVSLGPEFYAKGTLLGEAVESTIEGSWLDYDVIYLLASCKERALIEERLKVEFKQIGGGSCLPVTLIDPQDHGFSLDVLAGPLEKNGLFKPGYILSELQTFVLHGTDNGDLTSFLIYLSQKIGLGSLAEKMGDLERTTNFYARELCSRYPTGKEVLFPSILPPKNRKKHIGGKTFNKPRSPDCCDSEDDDGDDDDDEEEEDDNPFVLREASKDPRGESKRKKRRIEKELVKSMIERGVSQNVSILDFSSHYPRQIIFLDLSPEKREEPKVIPKLLRELLDMRKEAKKEGDRAKEQALKLLANIMYGWGSKFFPELGARCTEGGRRCLTAAEEFLRKYGVISVFADTDSLFAVGWKSDTNRQIFSELQDFLLKNHGALITIQGVFDVLVCCEAKKSYLATPAGTSQIVGKSLFQERPSAPAFYRNKLSEASAQWIGICKAALKERRLITKDDEQSKAFINRQIEEMSKALNPFMATQYQRMMKVNLKTLFSYSKRTASLNTRNNGKAILVSSYISGYPISLNNPSFGYVHLEEKPKDIYNLPTRYCVTVPFFIEKLATNQGLDQKYMNRYYYMNPLISMIHRSLGMTSTETDSWIIELWK